MILSDEGSLLDTLDLTFRISAVYHFIFRFVFQHCLRSTLCLLHCLNYIQPRPRSIFLEFAYISYAEFCT